MEQQLDGRYLHAGPLAKASAIAIVAVSVGASAWLASWGLSSIWRPLGPAEISVRISNPEVRLKQDVPVAAKRDGSRSVTPPPPQPQPRSEPKTSDVIRREVTVFTLVKYGAGHVVTGWKYRDGSGGSPSGQFCYYTAPNADGSSTRVDIATNGVQLPLPSLSLVPDLPQALAKCQWWQA